MMRSLYAGVSGLKTHQTKMDVIGNNISNVNTVAFKSSSTTFADIMYQTTSGASGATATTGGINPTQIGLGTQSGSIKVSIAQAGAAQNTGNAFDIKLTDSNSTNFFVVNNGSENLFTRAGSFYLDGNGNLAMTSTGYLVMGWQVDPDTGNIRKDTVSPLRIMQAANLTSEPEATTQANVSGIIDKNDTDVNSVAGRAMTLTFYDNLGYAYTAKFAVKARDVDKGEYTIALTSILDQDNIDILAQAIADTSNTTEKVDNIAQLFGKADSTASNPYILNSNYSWSGGQIVSPAGYAVDKSVIEALGKNITPDTQVTLSKTENGTTTSIQQKISDLFANASSFPAGITGVSVSNAGNLMVSFTDTNFPIKFNVNDGTFNNINGDGSTVMFNAALLGDQFRDITMDFAKALNYNNGGSSTMGIERGTVADSSDGAGKKLGAMTGVSIDKSGKIFGSYDNGNTVLLGQIAVAQFANASGLEALGDNVFTSTLNSGDFDGIGVEVTADGGKMSSGQLEMSNVDLSTEFTEMITTQRGFQANSRIITVSDTLLEELTNLKR
ncbi:MAG: flagellar hook-basal body complex protein [Lachnospiraceae bacterium]|nr:flagellar hook-basal body complex protein [Lachnospiraceae bacterium]MBQ2503700.1 flagellar hook-basal body complex protein [Lachnospiraceae bacterium]MBQ2579508.1 flagellar hook-basal body complex protein [Lachnospiraceae bacterium]MBQ5386651.1 flagellar hook-basal body complex protein [Lachnospiraceae bacterium]